LETKNKITILIGISGSGKSTWVSKNAKSATYINADTIREELTGDPSDQTKNKEVFQEVFKRFKTACTKNKDIAVDNTSLTFDNRKSFYDLIPPDKFEIVLVYFKPNLEKALKQNKMRERQVPEDVIKKQLIRLEEPNKWEKENATIITV
jgi:predicted kinase